MKLHIGQAQLKGAFDAYARKFSLLELLAEPHRLPKLAKLRQWRASAPEGFVFSVVTSPRCLTDEPDSEAMLEHALKVAGAVGAQWLVVRSGPELRPGAAAERRLAAILERLRGASPDVRLAWEPRGLWSGPSLRRSASALGVCPVVDASDAEPAEVLYVRHRQIGVGVRAGGRRTENLALACVQSGEALVVVDGGSALPLKRELEVLLSEFTDDDDDDDDVPSTPDSDRESQPPDSAANEHDLDDEEETDEDAEEDRG